MIDLRANSNNYQCSNCGAGPGVFHDPRCVRPDEDAASSLDEKTKMELCRELAEILLPCFTHASVPQVFRTVFLTQIHSCYAQQDEADAWMAREEMLPFAPVPKTIFTRPDGWVAWAVEVQWDGEMFVVYSKRHTELFDRQAQNRVGRGITEIVREYEQQGWTFIGNGINPPIQNLETKKEKSDEPKDEQV